MSKSFQIVLHYKQENIIALPVRYVFMIAFALSLMG